MTNFLETVRKKTLERVSKIGTTTMPVSSDLDFTQIFAASKLPVIAEIKFASPSKGTIYQGKGNHLVIASQYLENGAAALSVLTEPVFFKGDIQYIVDIRKQFPQVPILLKDFVLSELQIKQAQEVGANAVLLIAAFLEPNCLKNLYEYTLSLGLTPLLEVCSLIELELIEPLCPKVVLVNNRNLNTLEINFNTSQDLISEILAGTYAIGASGIKNGQELKAMRQMGYQGALIGTALMENDQPGMALKKILQESRDES